MEQSRNNEIIQEIKFFENCDLIEQDFRGHSSALRYICSKNNDKYFVKIYEGNRIENLQGIDDIYTRLEIPTATIFEKGYLKKFNKTYVVYEYIEGKTLKELTKELEVHEIEETGYKVGNYLSRFEEITCNKEEIIEAYELEFKELVTLKIINLSGLTKREKEKISFLIFIF